jgi:hypothetical protein
VQGKRDRRGVLLLALVAVLMLSLPLVASAQTTTTGTASAAAVTTNGITNPTEGANLSGSVEVRGYASSPNFMKWQLDLLPNGDATQATFLALGETPGVFTYTLDTTNFPAGEHALRLRVVRNDSNYDEFLTRFTIGKAAAAGGATTGTTGGTSTTGGTGAGSGTTTSTGTTGGSTATTGGATGTSSAGVTTNGLAAPREGQNISGQFVVRGFASDPNFMKWQLDLLPNGDPNAAAFLALGETGGVFTYTLDTTSLPAGQHALRLRVVRNDSNYSEYTTNFTIGNAATTGGTSGAASGGAASSGTTGTTGTTGGTGTSGTGPTGSTGTTAGTGTTGSQGSGAGGGTASGSGAGVTTNGLAAPTEGQTVKGQVVVKGYASDPNFMKWQLDLLPNGDATQATFLTVGETPGVFTYTLDTTNFPAGKHALRLRVVRNDSNYSEYTTNFTIGQ